MSKTRCVTRYTTGTLAVHFPQGLEVCLYCPCLARDFAIRCRCTVTGELLPYPEDSRGAQCPIQFPTPPDPAPWTPGQF